MNTTNENTHEFNSAYPFITRTLQLETLKDFLKSTSPLMLLLGQEGIGKRALLNRLIADIQASTDIIEFSGNASLDPNTLIDISVNKWQLALDKTLATTREQLDQIITDCNNKNRKRLIIIDQAQDLPIATLAALSHLTIKQEQSPVYLYVLLSGEPGLLDKIKSIQDRKIPHTLVEPLSHKETSQYIKFCLSKAKDTINPDIDKDTIDKIFIESHGYSMLIKKLVEENLLGENNEVSHSNIADNYNPTPPLKKHAVKIIAIICLILILLALWILKNRNPDGPKNNENLFHFIKQAVDHPKAPAVQSNKQATKPILDQHSGLHRASHLANTKHSNMPTVANPLHINAKGIVTAASKQTLAKTKKVIPHIHKKILNTQHAAYTLQLFASHSIAAARRFIRQHHLQNQAAISKRLSNQGVWYMVTYGYYDLHKQAEIARAHLPIFLKKLHPWIRRR